MNTKFDTLITLPNQKGHMLCISPLSYEEMICNANWAYIHNLTEDCFTLYTTYFTMAQRRWNTITKEIRRYLSISRHFSLEETAFQVGVSFKVDVFKR